MKLDDRLLLFLGDNHGEWSALFYELKLRDITNCNIFSVGDLGIGFSFDEEQNVKFLNKEFKRRNINFYGIRGNHDNPLYFKGDDRIVLSNFELIEDYTIIEYGGKTIQCIGGATSVDRTGRLEGLSYWKDETVDFVPDKCSKVDVLVTHTAPSYCFPQQFNDMVYGWAEVDHNLIQDLTKEKKLMDEIFSICRPAQHFYGHFHSSHREVINDCKHVLLDIDELYELKL
jgi:hypothetical protein